MLTLATEGAVQELTGVALVISIFAHMQSSSEAIACKNRGRYPTSNGAVISVSQKPN
jgi:hypothetical protein